MEDSRLLLVLLLTLCKGRGVQGVLQRNLPHIVGGMLAPSRRAGRAGRPARSRQAQAGSVRGLHARGTRQAGRQEGCREGQRCRAPAPGLWPKRSTEPSCTSTSISDCRDGKCHPCCRASSTWPLTKNIQRCSSMYHRASMRAALHQSSGRRLRPTAHTCAHFFDAGDVGAHNVLLLPLAHTGGDEGGW